MVVGFVVRLQVIYTHPSRKIEKQKSRDLKNEVRRQNELAFKHEVSYRGTAQTLLQAQSSDQIS